MYIFSFKNDILYATTYVIKVVFNPFKKHNTYVLIAYILSAKTGKCKNWISPHAFAPLVAPGIVMPSHGHLACSSLWQPTELARRMLGERPSPVPPTRELWPPQEQRLSISTLQLAYQREYREEDFPPRRTLTLPSQPYYSTTEPIECDELPRYRSVSTNTDPPPTMLSRIRRLLRRDDDFASFSMSIQSTMMEPEVDRSAANPARRAVQNIKKALTGAKYRVAPDSENTESPKIVYNTQKPGDRMMMTFGAKKSRKCFKFPSRVELTRRLRTLRDICGRRSPESCPTQRPPLQITQV